MAIRRVTANEGERMKFADFRNGSFVVGCGMDILFCDCVALVI